MLRPLGWVMETNLINKNIVITIVKDLVSVKFSLLISRENDKILCCNIDVKSKQHYKQISSFSR